MKKPSAKEMIKPMRLSVLEKALLGHPLTLSEQKELAACSDSIQAYADAWKEYIIYDTNTKNRP